VFCLEIPEPQNKEQQNLEVKDIVLLSSKTSAVSAEGGFHIQQPK